VNDGFGIGNDASPAIVLERGGLGIGRAMNGDVDALQHAVHVGDEVVVPEADDAKARRLEPMRARFVAENVSILSMLRTIDFDHEPCGHACEVGDIGPNGHLPAKMCSMHWPMTQTSPQPGFGIGLVETKPSSGLASKSVDRTLGHVCHPTPPPAMKHLVRAA
jgi:hypothetical protein